MISFVYVHILNTGHWGIPDTHIQTMSWALGRVQRRLSDLRDSLRDCLRLPRSAGSASDGHRLFKGNPGTNDDAFGNDPNELAFGASSSGIDSTVGEDSPFQNNGGGDFTENDI
jgi:hypothetical protein